MKKMNVLFFLFITGGLFAQFSSSVTTNRYEEPTELIQKDIDVFESESFENFESLTEFISKETRFESHNGSLSIYGLGENAYGKITILLNGVRIPNFDMNSFDIDSIPIGQIDRIEIVYGGGSVQYGDGAIGATINLITENPEELEAKVTLRGTSTLGYEGGLSLAGNNQRFNLTFDQDISMRENNDTTTVGTSYSLTPFESSYLYTLYTYTLNEFSGSISDLSDLNATSSPDDLGSQHLTNITFKLDLEGLQWSISDILEVATSDMYSWSTYADTFKNVASSSLVYTIEQFEFSDYSQTYLLGVDYENIFFKVERFSELERVNELTDINLIRNSISPWLSYIFNIKDTFKLNMGYHTNFSMLESYSHTEAVVGSKVYINHAFEVGLVFLNEYGKLYANLVGGYRLPFVEEQVSYYGWGDAFYGDIEPEESITFSLGGNLYDFNLDSYFILMKDEIIYDNESFRNNNIGRSVRYGFDVKYPIELGDFVTTPYYGYSDSENQHLESKEMPLISNHKLGVDLDYINEYFSVTNSIMYSSDFYKGGDYENEDDKVGEKVNWDIRASYYLEDLTFNMNILNILNDRTSEIVYKGFSQDGYYPTEGLRLELGVTWKL